jgi:flagellar assembly factor FliW
VKIATTRFGDLEIPEENVVAFPEGLPGFDTRRFILLKHDQNPIVEWLQSVDQPEIALMTIDPRELSLDYRPDPKPGEVRAVVPEGADQDQLHLRVIMRVGEQAGTLYLNLFAPLLFNVTKKLGMQVPLVGSGFSVRHVWPAAAVTGAPAAPAPAPDPED